MSAEIIGWLVGVALGALFWFLIMMFGSTFYTGGSILAGLVFLSTGALLLIFWSKLPVFLRKMVGTVTFFAFLAFTGIISEDLREGVVSYWKGMSSDVGYIFKGMAKHTGRYSFRAAMATDEIKGFLDQTTNLAYREEGSLEDKIFPRGEIFRVMDYNIRPVGGKGPEGLVYVMARDKDGYYNNGPCFWVVSRKLDFNFNQTAFLNGLWPKKEKKEAVQWGPVETVRLEVNDPKGLFIPRQEGHYRVWASQMNRQQYMCHKNGGMWQDIKPNGDSPFCGGPCRGTKMAPFNPLPDAPPWSVYMLADNAGPAMALTQTYEVELTKGVYVNLNCPQVPIPDDLDQPEYNWILNKGPVYLNFQRRV